MVEDRDAFCPSRYDKCSVSNEMTEIFAELQDIFIASYFFYPRTSVVNNQEDIPCQPVLWRTFNSVINKGNKKFRTEIGKSVKHRGLV